MIDNDIADGPDGDFSYLVDISNGGDLLMQGNRLEKGPKSSNTGTAVSIGAEGVTHPTHALIIRNNSFTSDLPETTVFVRNLTTTPAVLSGNHLHGRVTPLVGPVVRPSVPDGAGAGKTSDEVPQRGLGSYKPCDAARFRRGSGLPSPFYREPG